MSRIALIGIQPSLDLGPAKNDFAQWVREIQAQGIQVPLSVSPGGQSVGGSPATTLGGGNLGTFSEGAASQNIGVYFGRLEQALSSLTAVMERTGGGGGGGGAPAPSSNLGGGAAFDAEKRRRAFEYAHLQDQSITEQTQGDAAARRQGIVDRTRGTYRDDPGASLNIAIADAADMERLSYPAPPAVAGPDQGALADEAGGGRGGANPFRRLVSHLAGGYAVYAGINASLGYGINRQIESVYAQAGDQRGLLGAQENTYRQAVGNFGILGTVYDYFSGGSASLAQDDLEIQRGRDREQSNLKLFEEQRRAVSNTYDARTQIGAARIRNTFDREDFVAGSNYGRTILEGQQERARLAEQIPLAQDPATLLLRQTELSAFEASQGVVEANAKKVLDAQRGRNAVERDFAQEGRDLGFNTSISQSLYAANNDPLGGALAGVFGQVRGGMLNAASSNNPQDVPKVIAQGIAEAFKDVSTTSRSLGLQAMGFEGNASVASLLLARDPSGAAVAGINAGRDRTLAAMPDSWLFNLIGGDRVRAGVNAEADAKIALVGQRRADQLTDISAGLYASGGQLDALLDRNPYGAQAIGIASAAQQQKREFERNVDTQQFAPLALENGIKQLELEKQNFTDSIRGTAFDTRLFDTTNPRDTENIGKAMASIEEQIRGLRGDIKDGLDSDDTD